MNIILTNKWQSLRCSSEDVIWKFPGLIGQKLKSKEFATKINFSAKWETHQQQNSKCAKDWFYAAMHAKGFLRGSIALVLLKSPQMRPLSKNFTDILEHGSV